MPAEYKTYEQITSEVQRHLGATFDTTLKTKIQDAINRHYLEACRRYRWPHLLRDATGTFTANNAHLYLPAECDHLIVISVDNQVDVPREVFIEQLVRNENIVLNNAGLVRQWAPMGELGRKADFSSTAEVLEVTPDSSETATVDTYLHGVVSGIERTETVSTTAGTAADSTLTYADLISVSTNGSHTKPISIVGKSSTTTYAEIAPGERTARYRRIRLHFVPNSADAITFWFKKRTRPLVDDDQVPEIPVAQFLFEATLATMYSEDRKWLSAMQTHEQRAQRILDEIVSEEIQQEALVKQAVPEMGLHNSGPGVGRRRRQIVINNNG